MSGHSHAKTIKHQKEITDQKRGNLFSKLARMISVSAKEKGGNPETNSALRIAIEKAREVNMPQENIERAIKKGTGELEGGAQLEEVIFEAYGPGGIAVIIEGITDNKNRALSEIKQILNLNGGKLVDSGSVKWLFEKMGYIVVDLDSQSENFKNKETLEMSAIEAEVKDIYWRENVLDIYTKIEDLYKIKKYLEEKGIRIKSASLDWIAKERIQVDEKTKENCQKLFEILDENETVQGIYSNLKV